ncbi:glycosyltransferase family 39 protein [Candidatus Gottesmanbacteria bacterium]|nr:glycosyltransferase family 39 protein [Candidatus Gottesmanbacteria bacterium]
MPKIVRLLLLLILTLSLYLRTFGINWDSGFHLHPDERMIIMVADKIQMDSLNPKFFAYGSFPIYLLSGVSSMLNRDNYDGMLIVGRGLSVIFDITTTLVVFYIALFVNKLKRYKPALLASFFYCISVLPIQAAHFYAVDTTLTMLSTLTLLILIKFLEKPTTNKAVLLGIAFGLAVATKITIVLLAVPIVFVLFSIGIKSKKIFVSRGLIILGMTLLTFAISMPYAIIDRLEFIKQITLQLQMNKNAYIFPYTLQYVGATPYVYYLKNIVLWGLGLPLGIIALISVVYQTLNDFRNTKKLILIIFFWVYFLAVGRSAVKFMRYILPLYPLMAVFSAVLISEVIIKFKKYKLLIVTCYLLIFSCLVWPFSFINIYKYQNTRLSATNWINNNIPYGSNIAVEHWDDRLPLAHASEYQITDLPLYEPDNQNKWNNIVDILVNSEYIIIASNRLYIPLPKLTNCTVHKNHCYPITTNYYNQLFSGNLGFEQTETFEVYPKVPILNMEIDDLEADESFTVYDHPKIMIFKKTTNLSKSELLTKLLSNPH